MARPQRCRRICREPESTGMEPIGFGAAETRTMTKDEYETIRLMDYEGLTHVEAAQRMDVSRTTVTEIYDSARRKLADALVNGYRLEIAGGNTRVCGGASDCPGCSSAPVKIVSEASLKGANTMRIAVTYENGQIFQHFGHTEQFKVYDVENGAVTHTEVIGNQGQGHGALATLLQGTGVDVLICGGIGGGARNALAQAGITLYGGASGDADAAVSALLHDNLNYDPDAVCNHHHGEGHNCGDHHHDEGHSCGSHGCH